ncbi:MAG: hypothetical protein BJ554DRAFT_4143, partial [Olpidium bornovanus]
CGRFAPGWVGLGVEERRAGRQAKGTDRQGRQAGQRQGRRRTRAREREKRPAVPRTSGNLLSAPPPAFLVVRGREILRRRRSRQTYSFRPRSPPLCVPPLPATTSCHRLLLIASTLRPDRAPAAASPPVRFLFFFFFFFPSPRKHCVDRKLSPVTALFSGIFLSERLPTAAARRPCRPPRAKEKIKNT